MPFITEAEYRDILLEIERAEARIGTRELSGGSYHAGVERILNGLTPNTGAFGRLRTVSPFTLFDGKTLLDANPRDWDDTEFSGSGTGSFFSQERASTTLTVEDSTAGRRVRQTYRTFPYIPGKSQLALLTFVLGNLAPGFYRRVGLLDEDNGLALYADGEEIGFLRRSNVTGSPVDVKVPQAQWNLDTLDGNGPSGITLDVMKTQILVIDYEWLGVGRVRMGFDINGTTVYAHEFLNANNLDSVYVSTPNLPLRYEIENDGTGDILGGGKFNPPAFLECICSTVISEGGEDPVGREFGVANAEIRNSINGSGATRYALLGLRIKAANAGKGSIEPVRLSIIGDTGNDAFGWDVILGGTVAGSPVWTDVTNSVAQWFDGTSDNTITGGTVVASGIGYSRSAIEINPRYLPGPGVSAAGVPQELHFCIRPYENMQSVAGLSWVER